MLSPFIAFITLGTFDLDFNWSFNVLAYVGAILVLFFSSNNNRIIFPKYLWFYLLFLLYEYYSTFVLLERNFKMIYLVSNLNIATFLTLFIIENISVRKKYYHRIFKISKIVLIIAVIVILIQQFVDPYFFVDPFTARVFKEDDPNSQSLFSIYSWVSALGPGLSFIPVLFLIIEDLDKKRKNRRVLVWMFIGLMFAFLTKERWIMLNATMAFLVILVTKKYKFKFILRYLAMVPVILALSFVVLKSADVDVEGIVFDTILESDKNVSNKSAGTRILAFTAFNKFYWKNPIFGMGNIKYGMGGTDRQDYDLENFLRGRSSQLHVGYLALFYIFGLVGGILFIGFMYLFIKRMYLHAKLTNRWAPFFGVLSFFVANLTLVTFSLFEMGIIFAILADKYFVQQHNRELKLTN